LHLDSAEKNSTQGRKDQLVDLFDRHPLGSHSVTMPQLTLLDAIAASPGCGIQGLATGLNL
jgi:hypothetical protein